MILPTHLVKGTSVVRKALEARLHAQLRQISQTKLIPLLKWQGVGSTTVNISEGQPLLCNATLFLSKLKQPLIVCLVGLLILLAPGLRRQRVSQRTVIYPQRYLHRQIPFSACPIYLFQRSSNSTLTMDLDRQLSIKYAVFWPLSMSNGCGTLSTSL